MPLHRTRSYLQGMALSSFERLPAFLSDNEYIREGYRVGWRPIELLLSVFQLHNETVNIWTHMLPLVYFGATFLVAHEQEQAPPPLCSDEWAVTRWLTSSAGAQTCLHRPQPPTWPMWVFRAGVVACFVGSTVGHTFACHSPSVSDTLWQFDYAGIAILITTSFFPPVFYGLGCAAPTLSTVYLFTIVALGIMTVVATFSSTFTTTRMRPFRALLYVLLGSFGAVPLVHLASLHWGTGARNQYWSDVFRGEVAMAASYLSGAAVFATRVPERFFPGQCDLVGASHQVFHVFIVLGTMAHIYSCDTFRDWAHFGDTCTAPL